MMQDISQKVLEEMKNYFGEDTRRINHALKVLEFASKLMKQEGGNPVIIECAAILHDIGIKESERKYNSAAGNYQEIEGPPVAKVILEKLGFSVEDIDHICEIIANHHSDKGINTCEFRIIWDADWLVNIPDEIGLENPERVKKVVGKVFKTETGRRLAKEIYLTD